MKVAFTYHFTVEDRLAIAQFYGDSKPASHSELKAWMLATLNGEIEVMQGHAEQSQYA